MANDEENASAAERIATLEKMLAEKSKRIAALEFNKARMQAMLDNSPVGVFQDDGANHCLYVNDAWCAIVGLTVEEALGVGWLRIFHPDDLPWLGKRFAEARAEGKPFSGDYRVVRPSGEVRWVHGQSVPVIGSDGRHYGYVGTLHDITERVEARRVLEETRATLEQTVSERTADLQRANERLRAYGALFERATDAILLATPGGTITHVNPAYERQYGSSEEAIGQSLADALDFEGSTGPVSVDGRGTPRQEARLRARNGDMVPVHVDSYCVSEHDGEVIAMAVVIRDLSAEKRAQAERIALETKVIEGQAAVIRELSTPLMPIARGIIAMPLVGSINEGRAELIVETLLTGIVQHRAKTAIVDITGVTMVDTHAAHALVTASNAARLLGTRVFLSGIAASVAQTIIELGIDLSTMTTTGTLASAIAMAMNGRMESPKRS